MPDLILDRVFFVFHAVLIAFNLFGWGWRKTRRANLIALLLTGCSWFGLGLVYGIGYCPCTDWHWQVRYRLGNRSMPDSYIKFLVDSATGLDVNARLVDVATLVCFLAALAISLILNWRDRRRNEEGRIKKV